MRTVAIAQTTDDLWVASTEDGRVVGVFYPEGGGWWYAAYANGISRRLWEPAGPQRVARRLFRRR